MATINGTSNSDLVHMAGDGQPLPFGFTDIAQATDTADTISTGLGDDRVYAYGGADVITTGDGNDYVDAGLGNDDVNGGDGNDLIIGGEGVDVLRGGLGQDVFQIRQMSDINGLSETIGGGADYDKLDFGALGAFGPVDISKAAIINMEELDLGSGTMVTLTAAQLGRFSVINGTHGLERLVLSASGTVDLTGASISLIDEIRGAAGDDTVILTGVSQGQAVNGLGGNDTLTGGLGNDLLNGAAGDDTLSGDRGQDTLIGAGGSDTLSGGDGKDVLIGGAGLDTQSGGAGDDDFQFQFVSAISGLAESIDGGGGHDRLDFATQNAGGAVDLSKAVITGIEELDLASNFVTMTGAQLSAIKTFTTPAAGWHYNRLILAAPGTADFTGASFNRIDSIVGSSGADVINLTGVTTAPEVLGGTGADQIIGGLANDLLEGDDGADIINGGDGNDSIIGGRGADHLLGGVGYDDFHIEQLSDISGLKEVIDGGSDIDRLDFREGLHGPVDISQATITSVEELDVNHNDVILTAAQLSAFDSIIGSIGADRLTLSAAGTADLTGANLSLIDEIRGTSGADTFILTGVTQGLALNGLDGNDTLSAGDGDDAVNGGIGDDTISGGGGNDLIIGGQGADSLTGNAGADTFRFFDVTESSKTGAHDVITDFLHGQDVINLAAVDANSEVAGDQAFTFVGGANFTHVAGELRYAGGGQLLGDVNGDGLADLQINLTGAPTVTVGDLVL